MDEITYEYCCILTMQTTFVYLKRHRAAFVNSHAYAWRLVEIRNLLYYDRIEKLPGKEGRGKFTRLNTCGSNLK